MPSWPPSSADGWVHAPQSWTSHQAQTSGQHRTGCLFSPIPLFCYRTVAWWKRLPSLSSFKRLHKIGTTSSVSRKENHHREIKQPAQYHPANNGRMGFEPKSTWYFQSPSSLHPTHAFPGTRPVRNMRISGNRSCHMGERIKFSPCDFFPIPLLVCPCFNVTLFLKQLYRDVIHIPHNKAI